MEAKYIKLSDNAKFMGINYRTAWIHFHKGKLNGYQDSDTNTIYIENPEYNNIPTNNSKRAVLYARVSSTTNKASLDGQIERLTNYAIAKGYTIVDEKKEIASGLNENRKKLNSLLKRNDYDILLVEHKDRLTRFGANYIELALNNNGMSLEIVNKIDKKDNELLDDFVSIVTSFCGRIYGSKRRAKTEEIIEKLKE